MPHQQRALQPDPAVDSATQWRSAVSISYGSAIGQAIVRYLPGPCTFEFALPGASTPLIFSSTSFDEVHRLKDRLEATLGSADDIRASEAFVDRYASLRP
jgi:hypothetical protein